MDGFVSGGPHTKELIPLVEERWADCEQPIFTLAMFLHPLYLEVARATPDKEVSSLDSVCYFGLMYFKRFFRIVNLPTSATTFISGVPVTCTLKVATNSTSKTFRQLRISGPLLKGKDSTPTYRTLPWQCCQLPLALQPVSETSVRLDEFTHRQETASMLIKLIWLP